MSIDSIMRYADILAKFGQFATGLCMLGLSIFAICMKRRDLFRSELTKRRIDELALVRSSLQSIFYDIHFVAASSGMLLTMKWNIDEWKTHDLDGWEQYQRYKKTSTELFYKLTDRNYYLFPDWIDKTKISAFAVKMKEWAPFTIMATCQHSTKERENYMLAIDDLKDEFDRALKKNA